MENSEDELLIKVRKGAKVKIVESDDLGDRDVKVNLNKALKIEVNRVDSNELGSAASKIAMCG